MEGVSERGMDGAAEEKTCLRQLFTFFSPPFFFAFSVSLALSPPLSFYLSAGVWWVAYVVGGVGRQPRGADSS